MYRINVSLACYICQFIYFIDIIVFFFFFFFNLFLIHSRVIIMCPKDADRMENNVNHDQAAPSLAVA